MSDVPPGGGPAFPNQGDNSPKYPYYDGMSLRDWFAGQALAGMAIAPDYSVGPCNANLAQRAYAIADAMLAERAKATP